MSTPDPVITFLLDGWGHGFAAILGALFGSFANVCIYRWPPSDENPRGRSVVAPGSHCSECQAPVAWYDNIPLLSYFLLRGHCRRCGASFSPRYLLVEALTAMLFAAAYHLYVVLPFGFVPLSAAFTSAAIYAAYFFVLVVITFIDLDHKLILDKLTYPAIPLFYVLSLAGPGTSWWQGLAGAAVGYGLVRAISDGYYHLTGREGLGYGDGKLLAIVGALGGIEAVFVALFLGSVLGSVIGIATLLWVRARDRTRDDAAPSLRHTEIPFGPYLAAAAALHVFVAPWISISFG